MRIVAYIGIPDCNDCIVFEPILKHLVNEYKLSQEIKYVNVKNFREESEERWNSFKEKLLNWFEKMIYYNYNLEYILKGGIT